MVVGRVVRTSLVGVVAIATVTAVATACAPSANVGPTQTAAAPTTGRAPATTAATVAATTVAPTTVPDTTVPTTVAPTTAPPTTVPVDGRYPVASQTLTIVDPSRPTVSRGRTVATTRTLTTLTWRPTVAGRWPLIVFGHGFQVGPTPYITLLEAWAAAGYVVAAPEFPLTDQAVAGANLDENDIQQQPADVRYVLDTLVASTSPLAADIDPGRVLLAGHSDGAETVLAASETPAPAGEPAVRAVLCMGVSPIPGQTTTANPPILISQGDADTINPPSLGRATYAAAAGPKYYLDLLGGEHLPPLESGSRWLPTIEATTRTFFHLYADGGDPAALIAAGNVAGVSTLTASP